MLNNKIIIGLAQSDRNYGLSGNNKIKSINKILEKFKIKKLDTAPSYKNSNKIISNLDNKNIKVFSKLPNISCPKKMKLKKSYINFKKIYADNGISKLEGILLHNPLQPLDERKVENNL